MLVLASAAVVSHATRPVHSGPRGKPGALNLTVSATRPNGSLDAEVRLERIVSSDEAVSNYAPAAPAGFGSNVGLRLHPDLTENDWTRGAVRCTVPTGGDPATRAKNLNRA